MTTLGNAHRDKKIRDARRQGGNEENLQMGTDQAGFRHEGMFWSGGWWWLRNTEDVLKVA